MPNHRTVQPNHHFFWDSKLCSKRMKEISDWIGTFTPEQKDMLEDLLRDTRDEASWDGD